MKCPGPSFVAEHPMPEEALQTKLFAILVKSGWSTWDCPLSLEHPMPEEALRTTAFFHSSSLWHHMYKQLPSSLSLCLQVANTSGHTAHLAITSVWLSSLRSFKFQKSLVKFWSWALPIDNAGKRYCVWYYKRNQP
jgi:hypothetical protein